MKALVVYESMYGNTERVAQAVAAGLESFAQVDIVKVGDASPNVESFDLLVVGGPTHAFGMSRESTRKDAQQQTEQPVLSQRGGVRDWLSLLPRGQDVSVATFDTKVHKARRFPGCARGAAKALRREGYRPLSVESFFVVDTLGPLMQGELERASRWAFDLARSLGSPRQPT